MTLDLPRLMKQARAQDPAMRREALRELSSAETPDALSVLQAMGATDPDRALRLEATRAARELRTRISMGTMETAGREGVGLAALAERLRSPEPAERAKALFGCLRYESEKVLPVLAAMLERETVPKVRSIALAALGVLGSSADAGLVRRFEEDVDDAVRQAASEALEKLSEVAEPLPLSSLAPGSQPAVAARPTPPPSSSRVTAALRPGMPPPPAGASSTGVYKALRTTGPGPAGASGAFTTATSPAVRGNVPWKVPLKSGAGTPYCDRMSEDEKGRLGKLLASLSGGILSDLERSRLAERGSKIFQEALARLGVPGQPAEVLRGFFHLSAGNRSAAAEELRKAPRLVLLAPEVEPFLAQAFPEEEILALKEKKDDIPIEAKGRARFPPEILEMVLAALRKAKILMNELEVQQRTKFRPHFENLKDLLDKGEVEEAHVAALVMRREMTRLENVLISMGKRR